MYWEFNTAFGPHFSSIRHVATQTPALKTGVALSPYFVHPGKWFRTFKNHIPLLVGGLEHFIFFHLLGITTPTDFHFFSEELEPPTRLDVEYLQVPWVFQLLGQNGPIFRFWVKGHLSWT